MKISLLVNMKMPTIIGIFMFISRENFMLSWVEPEKKFYNCGARYLKQTFSSSKMEDFIINLKKY